MKLSSVEKPKFALICGPDVGSLDPQKLRNKYFLRGIDLEIIGDLNGNGTQITSIDSNITLQEPTTILISAHGNKSFKGSGRHGIRLYVNGDNNKFIEKTLYTSKLFSEISKIRNKEPVNVELSSCYGNRADLDICSLPENSTFMSFVSHNSGMSAIIADELIYKSTEFGYRDNPFMSFMNYIIISPYNMSFAVNIPPNIEAKLESNKQFFVSSVDDMEAYDNNIILDKQAQSISKFLDYINKIKPYLNGNNQKLITEVSDLLAEKDLTEFVKTKNSTDYWRNLKLSSCINKDDQGNHDDDLFKILTTHDFNIEALKTFLSNNVDIKQREEFLKSFDHVSYLLHFASVSGMTKSVKHLLYLSGKECIHNEITIKELVRTNQIDNLQLVIDGGTDISNINGLIHIAAMNNKIEMLELLLNHVDINQNNDEEMEKIKLENTAIRTALDLGNVQAAKYLFQRGAYITNQDLMDILDMGFFFPDEVNSIENVEKALKQIDTSNVGLTGNYLKYKEDPLSYLSSRYEDKVKELFPNKDKYDIASIKKYNKYRRKFYESIRELSNIDSDDFKQSREVKELLGETKGSYRRNSIKIIKKLGGEYTKLIDYFILENNLEKNYLNNVIPKVIEAKREEDHIYNEFLKAIEAGNEKSIQELTLQIKEIHKDINIIVNPKGKTLLNNAIRCQKPAILKTLIEEGAVILPIDVELAVKIANQEIINILYEERERAVSDGQFFTEIKNGADKAIKLNDTLSEEPKEQEIRSIKITQTPRPLSYQERLRGSNLQDYEINSKKSPPKSGYEK